MKLGSSAFLCKNIFETSKILKILPYSMLEKRKDFCIMKNDYLNSICTQVNSLSYDQLNLLFSVYFQLNLQFNFFMPEHKHSEFMTLYHETFSKNNLYTYRSLINILTTVYTSPSRYPSVLTAIDLLKKDISLFEIINVLYHNR